MHENQMLIIKADILSILKRFKKNLIIGSRSKTHHIYTIRFDNKNNYLNPLFPLVML